VVLIDFLFFVEILSKFIISLLFFLKIISHLLFFLLEVFFQSMYFLKLVLLHFLDFLYHNLLLRSIQCSLSEEFIHSHSLWLHIFILYCKVISPLIFYKYKSPFALHHPYFSSQSFHQAYSDHLKFFLLIANTQLILHSIHFLIFTTNSLNLNFPILTRNSLIFSVPNIQNT